MTDTTAQRGGHRANREISHRRRHSDDPLSPEQIDRIVLQAALDGCDYHEIQARLFVARETATSVVTFTYPSTGTVHAVSGDYTVCGSAWVAGFRVNHPNWATLFNPAGHPSDVTCRACQRRMEYLP